MLIDCMTSSLASSPTRKSSVPSIPIESLAIEAEAFGDDLLKIEQRFDEFVRSIIHDANDEFGALTEVEQLDLFQGSLSNIAGNWDYPFRRRAEELREAFASADLRRVA